MGRNIDDIDNCYGCGVCTVACPRSIVQLHLNGNGFYEASVCNESCIQCGLCLQVCAFVHKERAIKSVPLISWAAWSNDEEIRRGCSSGGIGFEIGKQLIEKGYKAIGCRYDVKNQRAEHFIASTVDEFIPSIGSKYIQSYTASAFKDIDFSKRYLVVGTPCQIDSFRRLIQKRHCEDNFVLMDFFCHCVPSMLAWNAYVRMVESKIGQLSYVSWRNKFQHGWHDSWIMGIDGSNLDTVNVVNITPNPLAEHSPVYQSKKSQGDLFYKLFLGDVCMGPQCEKDCKYKYDQSSADIRVGDMWGKTYQGEEKGVSALIAFTEKGCKVVNNLHDVTLVEHPFEVVAEGQMKRNARLKESAPIVMWLLKQCKPLDGKLFSLVFFLQRLITRIQKGIRL